jgi:hypothetical protein
MREAGGFHVEVQDVGLAFPAVLRNLKTSQTEHSQQRLRRLELAKQQVLQDTVAAAKVTSYSGGVMHQAPSRLIKRP